MRASGLFAKIVGSPPLARGGPTAGGIPSELDRRSVFRPTSGLPKSGTGIRTTMAILARSGTREQLEELLAERILLLDGSMGAYIYARRLEEEDYRGARLRNH